MKTNAQLTAEIDVLPLAKNMEAVADIIRWKVERIINDPNSVDADELEQTLKMFKHDAKTLTYWLGMLVTELKEEQNDDA